MNSGNSLVFHSVCIRKQWLIFGFCSSKCSLHLNFNLYVLEMPERPKERFLRMNIKLGFFFFKGVEVISCPSDLLLENLRHASVD